VKYTNVAGQVYRCLVCGAEVSVIKGGEGRLTPHCCNQPMQLQSRLNLVYRCSVCGAEVMVIFTGQGKLTPRCCNQYMRVLPKAA
jgi:desulfoferrodoxin-like iron-binding protein